MFLPKIFKNPVWVIAISLLSFVFGLSVSIANAQTQDSRDYRDQGGFVECDQTSDISFLGFPIWKNLDFHPLRPYPGSPCDQLIPKSKYRSVPEKPIAFQCGKSIAPQSIESFNPYGEDLDCKIDGDYAYCARAEQFDVEVDLKDAKIPILGNTENLNLDDSQKVNNYISWYLTGSAQNWLEDRIFPLLDSDINRLVNFSGPIRKLLPFEVQLKDRLYLIQNPEGVKENYHNYLAGCKEGGLASIISGLYFTRVIERFGDFFIKHPEYHGLFDTLQKLRDSIATDQAIACKKYFGFNIDTKYRLTGLFGTSLFYGLKLPPNPDDYPEFTDFWIKYIEWTGKKPIPLVGPLDLPIPFYLENHWAQLFQNVPFSSLEDTSSEVTISIFDDPRGEKQDLEIITQDKPWGVSESKQIADKLGLKYPTYGIPDTAEFRDKEHLADITIRKKNFDNSNIDSRVFIPNLKSVRALTDLLQSTYRPLPPTGVNISYKDLMTGKETSHQGIQDDIPVINKTNNNSSVRPEKAGPEALFGHSPDYDTEKFSYDAHCELSEVRSNPGDSLLGNKMSANLNYTQLFRFQYRKPVGPIPDGDQCVDNRPVDPNSGDPNLTCKSGKCILPPPPPPEPPVTNCNKLCETDTDCADARLVCVVIGWPGEARCRLEEDALSEQCIIPPKPIYGNCEIVPLVVLPTKGFAAVFTKLPYGEEIYKKLVAGPDSVFKRFMPYLENYDIKKIPAVSQVNYSSVKINKDGSRSNVETQAGNGNGSPEIYWEGLGSILDYVLGASFSDKNLQKLLRPRDFSVGTSGFDTGPGGINEQCSSLGYNIDYHNPSVEAKSVSEIQQALLLQNPGKFGSQTLVKANENIKLYYDKVVSAAQNAGYNPAFVLAIWIEESAASALSALDLGCGNSSYNNLDAQLKCFLNLYDFWSKDSPSHSLFDSCREGGDHPNFEDFMLFYAEGICKTVEAQNRQFCGAHSHFPARFKSFYDLVAK